MEHVVSGFCKTLGRSTKRDAVALWIAARDLRVTWYAKATAGAVATYALSPIDLIPDFIPIIGYLDDLVIVPLGIMAAVRTIPVALMEEFRQKAASQARPVSKAGLALIMLVWMVSALALTWMLWPRAT